MELKHYKNQIDSEAKEVLIVPFMELKLLKGRVTPALL